MAMSWRGALQLALCTLLTVADAAHREPSAEEAQFFAANAKRAGVTTLNSTLQYKVLRYGDGEFTPASTAALSAHFEAFELLSKAKVVNTEDKGPQPVDMYPETVREGERRKLRTCSRTVESADSLGDVKRFGRQAPILAFQEALPLMVEVGV